MKPTRIRKSDFDSLSVQAFFNLLQDELKSGLKLYWDCAHEILDKSGVKLHTPTEGYLSLDNNFFSALFLYSYFRGGISKSKRILFVAVNQCLRGMVTGCDNLLDNEYKQTLDTDLPENAQTFRSVLDIMVSDRILAALMHKGYQDGEFSFDQILQANTASLHALLKSGVQEASEEKGVAIILKPEDVLCKVHSLKTGILFQAPWVLPDLIEKKNTDSIVKIKKGLFEIGMGCQILDDMVDLSMDVRMDRNNYVVSLICHGENPMEKKILKEYRDGSGKVSVDPDFLLKFPDAKKASNKKALELLQKGTAMLFDNRHQFMVDYSIDFFFKRIGADRFFGTGGRII